MPQQCQADPGRASLPKRNAMVFSLKIHMAMIYLCYLKTQKCNKTVKGAVFRGECLVTNMQLGLQGPLQQSYLTLHYKTFLAISIFPLAAT